MQSIEPVGQKLIVELITKEAEQLDSGFFVMDLNLQRAIVVEVPKEYKDIYASGDTVIIPINAGISLPNYNGKNCQWVNAKGAPDGDIWGIVTEEKSSKKND